MMILRFAFTRSAVSHPATWGQKLPDLLTNSQVSRRTNRHSHFVSARDRHWPVDFKGIRYRLGSLTAGPDSLGIEKNQQDGEVPNYIPTLVLVGLVRVSRKQIYSVKRRNSEAAVVYEQFSDCAGSRGSLES